MTPFSPAEPPSKKRRSRTGTPRTASRSATRSIYDTPNAPRRQVPHDKQACPACAACPLCPPVPDCGEQGVAPTSTVTRAILVPDGDEPEHDKKAGLPASAIKLASAHVRE